MSFEVLPRKCPLSKKGENQARVFELIATGTLNEDGWSGGWNLWRQGTPSSANEEEWRSGERRWSVHPVSVVFNSHFSAQVRAGPGLRTLRTWPNGRTPSRLGWKSDSQKKAANSKKRILKRPTLGSAFCLFFTSAVPCNEEDAEIFLFRGDLCFDGYYRRS